MFRRSGAAKILTVAALLALAPALKADEGVEAWDGYEGVWLRTSKAEAFVALRPQFRILSIRQPGQPSLLADSNVSETGIRLAFLEGQQGKTSFDVGNQPAQVLTRSASAITVRLAPAVGLQYTATLTLSDTEPVIDFETHLANVGTEPRKISCWTVAAFARREGGLLIAPFDTAPRARRRIVLPWWTQWPQATVAFGRDVLVADGGAPMRGAYKVGIISNAGWIAYQRDGQAIVLTATFEPDAVYPEDGANLTLYQCQSERVWCEIEHVSPLRTIAPDEANTFRQAIRLTTLPNTPRPTTQPGQNETDITRLQLEAAGPLVPKAPTTLPAVP